MQTRAVLAVSICMDCRRRSSSTASSTPPVVIVVIVGPPPVPSASGSGGQPVSKNASTHGGKRVTRAYRPAPPALLRSSTRIAA
ncbi:MAG: hypothetical protein R3B70_30340 [Polyangiaceae bacterium]